MRPIPFHPPTLKRPRFRRQSPPGSLPGTVTMSPDAAETTIRLTDYGPDDATAHDNVSDADVVAHTMVGKVTWIDVVGLSDVSAIQKIARHFGLHVLAIEDVVNVHQRPKVEMYGDDILFLVVRTLEASSTLVTGQISFFLGRNFVITFQERANPCLDVIRERILTGRGRIRQNGADYLLYALLDAAIDAYFPALESFGERLDALDDRITRKQEAVLIERIHTVRTELLGIRRAVWPLRDAINVMIRDSGDLIDDATDLYLRDCYDHTVQIIDVIETDRELCADLRDYYLSVISNRMNEIMKVLTLIATLFIPLTFITGLYGMNFNPNASPWNMPELNMPYGYPAVLGAMAAVTGGLLAFFWRRGWLR